MGMWCPTYRPCGAPRDALRGEARSNALKAAFTGLSENGWMMWMKNDDEIVVDELGCRLSPTHFLMCGKYEVLTVFGVIRRA